MSKLPVPTLPSGSFTEGPLAGVEYHSLSRSQALKLGTMGGQEEDAEPFLLACGTDMTLAEARDWLNQVSPEVGGDLLKAIAEISGVSPGGVPEGG